MKARQVFQFIGGIGFLVLLLLSAVFAWPQLILNQTTLRWAVRALQKSQVKVDWASFRFAFESIGFLKKRISVDAKMFCVELPDLHWKGCADQLTGRLAIDISTLKLRFSEFKPILLNNLNWTLTTSKGTVEGHVDLEEGSDRPGFTRLRGDARLPDQSFVRFHGDIQLERFSFESPRLAYDLSVRYQRKAFQGVAFAKIHGGLEHHRWAGGVEARLDRWIPGIPSLQTKNCRFFLNRMPIRESWSVRYFGEFKLFCPIQAHLKPVPYDDYRRIPNLILGTLNLRLSSSDYFPHFETKFSGEAQLSLDPIRSRLVQAGGRIQVKLDSGVLGEAITQWRFRSNSSLRIEIPEFQRWIENFKRGPWAIPAPFNVFKGRILFDLDGEADWKTGSFPFHLSTQLHSSTQVLKCGGRGYLMFTNLLQHPDYLLGLDVRLTRVQVEIPRLDWAKPPRLIADHRFYDVWPPRSSQQKARFHYRISVATETGHPAFVLTNFSKQKVPVFFQIHFSDAAPLSGSVRVVSFPIEVFHRKAQVESLHLTFRDPLSSSLIFGSMQTSYADYKINIQLGATLERPQVHLLSEPALPESQILSVLLFGRPLDELSSIETSSVGNTRAAIADQALGLASLYALASTPIQSLAYDPMTRVISAKLKLAEGTSLNLGSNIRESALVEVQQRLGKNWSIQAGVESSEFNRGSASASLQWSRRY